MFQHGEKSWFKWKVGIQCTMIHRIRILIQIPLSSLMCLMAIGDLGELISFVVGSFLQMYNSPGIQEVVWKDSSTFPEVVLFYVQIS